MSDLSDYLAERLELAGIEVATRDSDILLGDVRGWRPRGLLGWLAEQQPADDLDHS